ncbi:hypothetical protein [Jeongeupia sp. USM3]|uniref:hypothetical protein n=1 Tax=Jeongeupia sp. USM3 TaxID=1906741 RepID=UPI001F2E53E8|nr:hypothetical protein [Jeongeupia sp. USM3]
MIFRNSLFAGRLGLGRFAAGLGILGCSFGHRRGDERKCGQYGAKPGNSWFHQNLGVECVLLTSVDSYSKAGLAENVAKNQMLIG